MDKGAFVRVHYFIKEIYWVFSGAPAFAEGALVRSIHTYRDCKPFVPRQCGFPVCPYAQIKHGDEFAFVLIWSPFTRKARQKDFRSVES